MSGWSHRVIRLDPAAADRNDRFRVVCKTNKCEQVATHQTMWQQSTGLRGRVSSVERLVCGRHARSFASRYKVPVEPAGLLMPLPSDLLDDLDPQRQTWVHVSCTRDGAWYLRWTYTGARASISTQWLSGVPSGAALDDAIAEAELLMAGRTGVPAGPWQRTGSEAAVQMIPAWMHETWSAREWTAVVGCDENGMWMMTRTLDEKFPPIVDHLGFHNMTAGRAVQVADELLRSQKWLQADGGWRRSGRVATSRVLHPWPARSGG